MDIKMIRKVLILQEKRCESRNSSLLSYYGRPGGGGTYIAGPPSVCGLHGLAYCGPSRDEISPRRELRGR
jgi:hypothetical protein